MTDLKTRLKNPEIAKTLNAVEEFVAKAADSVIKPLPSNGDNLNVEADLQSLPLVVKTARPNSKLILQNMEEVLNSVKKKHRQKHRRKKEQKKLAQLEAEAIKDNVDGQDHSTNGIDSPLEASKGHDRLEKRQLKKPLQEKAATENGLNRTKPRAKEQKSPLKNCSAGSANGSILKHFQRTPKKANSDGNVIMDVTLGTKEASSLVDAKKTTKTANAFEVMMNARNKSIGSNTPGKEAPATATAVPPRDEQATAVAKRKLLLQEWADRKGGMKRKTEDESRAAYVEQQLEQRAKRFKKMLTGDAKGKASNASSPDLNVKLKENANACKEKADEKSKRPKGRLRKSLQHSVESVDSVGTSTLDAETVDFLAKLSSPRKKRDSLLGYFPKKASPSEEIAKSARRESKAVNELAETQTNGIETDTSNRRARRSSKKSVSVSTPTATTSITDRLFDDSTAGSGADTPSGRPKRSCAGKARYDYDLEVSATKVTSSKPTPKRSHSVKQEEQLEVITLDDSNASDSPLETPKKLAPLFTRLLPKPSPDPETLKARQEFLRSGVPEKVRLEMAKQKAYEQKLEEAFEMFPKISHVQQLGADELSCSLKLGALPFNLKPLLDAADRARSVGANRRAKAKQRWTVGSITNCTMNDICASRNTSESARTFQHKSLPILENKRMIIKEWKANFDRFPTFKCYNQMREKYRYFSAIDSAQDTEQVTESFVVTRRAQRTLSRQKPEPEVEEYKPPVTAPNGELLFTEKYKPMLFEQVLVNLIPVSQLRDFLSNWSDGSGAGSGRNSQQLDDTFDYANDSNSSQISNCNTVVLFGPGSSGKTNAVFALANEMNFNVLEINAGMKRTGKKLIQELQEATQSHQIRKESTTVQAKSQKNLLKISLNGRKNKKHSLQSIDSDSSSSVDLSQSSRKCLILIEDADIVFDQIDAGFTDAIHTLASSSKRPVIIVATNPNCQHLQRFKQQNAIYFSPPNVLNITKFLAVLSLIENCPINMDDLISLYLYNGKNLRKTLLELQFFIQSGGDRALMPTEEQDAQFFASPSKRCFSVEPATCGSQSSETDEKLDRDTQRSRCGAKDSLYLHRTLFEFYTIGQNEQHRIPFPIDFRLLCVNLNDLLHVAQKFKATDATDDAAAVTTKASASITTTTKRRTRSPKKAWLNSATSAQSTPARKSASPLDALCDFYENISTAALLGTHGAEDFLAAEPLTQLTDRLVPHLTEDLAHELVEKAIEVNLAAEPCAYNLFDTPFERPKLCDSLAMSGVRSQRMQALDVEPALRVICRSERNRAAKERKSTRFYHYLRGSVLNLCNFSTEPFDKACNVLWDADSDVEAEPNDSTQAA